MSSPVLLSQIENQIQRLPYDERLWLVERLVHGLRRSSGSARPIDAVLAEMAQDPEMRRELAEIAAEFAPSDLDGLEQR